MRQEHRRRFDHIRCNIKVKSKSRQRRKQMKYLKQFVEFHGIPMPEIYEDASRSEISRLTDQLLHNMEK